MICDIGLHKEKLTSLYYACMCFCVYQWMGFLRAL